jgi:uncharacterized protein (UPF0332 family)
VNQKAIAKLVAEKRLRKLSKPPFDQVDRLLASSRKDVGIVKKVLAIDEAKAYDVAYDIMFKTALALMRAHGFRPAASLQHKTAVEFCEAVLDASWKETLGYLDDMRKKRNRLTYEADVIIGRPEAEAAIAEAEKFHAAVVKIIDGLRPRPKP